MFLTRREFRNAFWAFVFAAPGGGAAGAWAAAGGLEALAASAPTVRLVAPDLQAAPAAPAADCTAGDAVRCYESNVAARTVSVASFFDRKARNLSEHFMIKFFVPPTPGRYRIEGFSFTSNRADTYAGAGAFVTPKLTPYFPTTQQLSQLQRLNVHAAGGGVATCVDLASANVVLDADQAAWVILQYANAVDTLVTGVSVDPEAANDHACDFMTRDHGDLWYRPDPVSSPYDWKFTVFHAVVPAKQTLPWTHLKSLYR